MPTVDDLIYKIGVLTVENDALRGEIRKVTKERDELRAVQREPEADIEKESAEEKKD
jgi:hypothetical protein